MTTFLSGAMCAAALTAFALGPLAATASVTQEPHAKQSTDKPSKTRGPSLKVKADTAHLNRASRMPRPARKGGTSRGPNESCALHIDNETAYYVDIYMDGTFIGTVSPWGDSYASEPTGAHTLYATAPGTTLHWGPRSSYLDDAYTWTLSE